jgi:malonyl-CoA O-methyltransferase
MNEPSQFRLDRRALRRSFDRAGDSYDAAAVLQSRVRTELLARLDFFALSPDAALDLGAGTCGLALALRARFPRARVLGIDLALGMLRQAPRTWWPRRTIDRVCADANALPLQASSVDIVVSSLMLQWCDQPDAVFAEVSRVLRPGGLFVFSTFGPQTLHELGEAFTHADGAEHVSRFADLTALGDGLARAGLREPVMDVDEHRLHYADARSLMAELRRIGATHAAADRARGLMGRARLQRMIDAYEKRREAGGLPATYEVIFGTAFGGEPGAGSGRANAARDGEVQVPVGSITRRTRP